MKLRALWLALVIGGVLGCSPQSAEQYLAPQPIPKSVVDEDNSESFDPKADILFVIDNSGSMDFHQTNLARNIAQFTQVFLTKSVLDYNIGTLSSDTDGFGASNCCGRLNGTVKVVNKTTPNADNILRSNFLMGTGGSSDERFFDPVYLALTQPNIDGVNRGFYRQDAALIIIFITDADDQSRIQSADFLDFLLKLKGGNKDKVMSYAALIPTNDRSGCSRDPIGVPTRLEKFLSIVPNNKNNTVGLCDSDYGQKLADFASQIVESVSSVIQLSRPADVKSIRVAYGQIDLPRDPDKGWSFDPKRNAIVLGHNIDWAAQPPGSKVKVYYNAAKFAEAR